ncbi:hypothetical protein QUB80_31190 [Chlorogloeopsis sp. ULAP01]|uniref:hypothetical protein n=1 Tax=Chlorogloeopsis sp. ULAP01 TaxID=3056483 RepID=UPI0025AADC46|nr:hypothetical protein [Chlorogloeopsis sp. ULAP01]MDM9385124.1 hypothetical protein [Chlorogloeopsis sp. ULAP01]
MLHRELPSRSFRQYLYLSAVTMGNFRHRFKEYAWHKMRENLSTPKSAFWLFSISAASTAQSTYD